MKLIVCKGYRILCCKNNFVDDGRVRVRSNWSYGLGLGLGLGLEPCGLVNITVGRFGPASGRTDAFCAPRRPTPGAAGRADSEYAECCHCRSSCLSLAVTDARATFFNKPLWSHDHVSQQTAVDIAEVRRCRGRFRALPVIGAARRYGCIDWQGVTCY